MFHVEQTWRQLLYYRTTNHRACNVNSQPFTVIDHINISISFYIFGKYYFGALVFKYCLFRSATRTSLFLNYAGKKKSHRAVERSGRH
ncbi:hypothetical protein SAMN06295960_2375 [Paenibacillus aquistagni]|uniref:Uncharacterized protein n=1 Tax=Paenibacillus aquistagni TaxID=1852522 RepID=A0A1X7KJ02_9BACL|nr:hypothetical protein SAMN06295960_2375 [Paenibacillus aquistagni]